MAVVTLIGHLENIRGDGKNPLQLFDHLKARLIKIELPTNDSFHNSPLFLI